MKLPSFRRIITTDFDKEFKDLIENLGSTINDSFNIVYSALNKRLTFNDNIMCTVRDVQISVDSNGIPTTQASFTLDVKNTPVIGVVVLNPVNVTNSANYPTSAVQITGFTQNTNSIIINKIVGLEPGNLYRIKVIAIN